MGRRQRSRDRMRAERAAPNPPRAVDSPASESESTPTPHSAMSPEPAPEDPTSRVESEPPASNEPTLPGAVAAALVPPHPLEPMPSGELSAELELSGVPLAAESEPSSELGPPPSPSIEAREGLDRAEATAAIDAEIALAIAEGDTRRALGLCAELHGESVGRLCLALLGSQTEADAVTEEILLEAYRRPGEFGAQRSLRGWLLGLARRACVRRLERRPAKRRNGAEEPPPSSDPAVTARAPRARALLGRVRPSEREALVLRFAADASTDDVAVACDIEPAEAQRRVSRALARLRDALESETSDD